MKLIKFRNADQVVTAIAGDPGRIYTTIVWIDAPIRIHKVPNGEVDRFGRVAVWARHNTVKSAARVMLQAGKRLGITKGAKRFLRAATK